MESECGGVSCGGEKRGWMETLLSRQNVQLATHMYIHTHTRFKNSMHNYMQKAAKQNFQNTYRLLALCSLYIRLYCKVALVGV